MIDFSTISPNKSISIHKRLSKKNIFYVDCPVSGGTEGAHKGSLSLFIGASKKECLSFEHIFEVLGKSINYFNGVGKGQQMMRVMRLFTLLRQIQGLQEQFLSFLKPLESLLRKLQRIASCNRFSELFFK